VVVGFFLSKGDNALVTYYKKLRTKILTTFSERDIKLVQLGYTMGIVDFAEFPVENWAGETLTEKEAKVLVSALANDVRKLRGNS
jgi:hypothetical protein